MMVQQSNMEVVHRHFGHFLSLVSSRQKLAHDTAAMQGARVKG